MEREGGKLGRGGWGARGFRMAEGGRGERWAGSEGRLSGLRGCTAGRRELGGWGWREMNGGGGGSFACPK